MFSHFIESSHVISSNNQQDMAEKKRKAEADAAEVPDKTACLKSWTTGSWKNEYLPGN